MGVLARLFAGAREDAADVDDRSVARYRHLLRTAPVESIEQTHVDAFATLGEAQRSELYEQLSRGVGTGERPLSSEPATLARAAVRRERRLPGSLERTLRQAAVLEPVVDQVVDSPLLSAFLPWNG